MSFSDLGFSTQVQNTHDLAYRNKIFSLSAKKVARVVVMRPFSILLTMCHVLSQIFQEIRVNIALTWIVNGDAVHSFRFGHM